MKPFTDIQLYDFLKENNDSILKDMIEVQRNDENIPADISKEMTTITINAITSRLLDSTHFFKSHIKEWTAIITKRSLHLYFSVSYFADLLTKYRQIYSKYIEQFIISQGKSIEPALTCHWFTVINEGFDQLLSQYIHQMDTYKNKQLSMQQHLINEISTAVIPLVGQIGVLPITGHMDANRFEYVLKVVPDQCISLEVNHLFIDMSGVPVIDALIAAELSKLTKILSLLGISVIISGMKPEVALYTIHSGIDFSHFSTASTLKQALHSYGVKLVKI